MTLLKRFIKDQRGMETVEWVIMGAAIIVGISALIAPLLLDIGNGMETLGNEVQLSISIGQGTAP
jgi:Flp pilus assembly pilin Flp